MGGNLKCFKANANVRLLNEILHQRYAFNKSIGDYFILLKSKIHISIKDSRALRCL